MEASTILTSVRRVLRDTGGTRWSDSVLFDYLTQAELELVRVKPWAYTLTRVVKLTPNEVRHEVLPPGAISLLRVERNMGDADGKSPGKMITQMEKALLDASNKNWVGDSGEEIEGWAVDSDDLKRFYTYPKAHPSVDMWVEIIVSTVPPTLTATGDAISVPEEYRVILQQFVAGWALQEDDPGADFPRGAGFIKQAYTGLGLVSPEEEE